MSFWKPSIGVLVTLLAVVSALGVFALAARGVVEANQWLGISIGIVLIGAWVLGLVWEWFGPWFENDPKPRGFEVETKKDE